MRVRDSLLYESGLGFHCINHALGCSHRCRYPCYAFLMAWNYSARVGRDRATGAFYRQQSSLVRRFCAQQGIECALS